MPFNLEVDFSGLCLFVEEDPGRERVAILMPDGRRRESDDPPHHLDGREADPHVGFVRFNLANLVEFAQAVPPIPEGVDTDAYRGRPEYELLHRFDRQVLEFDGDFETEPMSLGLDVPRFEDFAPHLELLPGLFTGSPDVLLMRTILAGGSLAVSRERERFVVPTPFDEDEDHTGLFASAVRWTRRVRGDQVTVRITGLDGAGQAAFTLRPAAGGGTVTLKVANLCAHNPLDWRELTSREANGPDLDFKWLYRLFRPREGTWDELLQGTELPVPVLVKPLVSGSNDCMPGRASSSFS